MRVIESKGIFQGIYFIDILMIFLNPFYKFVMRKALKVADPITLDEHSFSNFVKFNFEYCDAKVI